MNIFEIATRNKTRFQTAQGLVDIEDLWALPLEKLDLVAQHYHTKASQASVSFILAEPVASKDDTHRLDILKHIIAVRRKEAEDRATAKDKAEKRQRLMEQINRRQEDAINALPIEELQKMLAAL